MKNRAGMNNNDLLEKTLMKFLCKKETEHGRIVMIYYKNSDDVCVENGKSRGKNIKGLLLITLFISDFFSFQCRCCGDIMADQHVECCTRHVPSSSRSGHSQQ